MQEEGGEVLAEILWNTSKSQFWEGRGEPDGLGDSFQPWESQSCWGTGKGLGLWEEVGSVEK